MKYLLVKSAISKYEKLRHISALYGAEKIRRDF